MCLLSFTGVKRGLSCKKRKQTDDAREQKVQANSWTLPVGSDWRKKCKLNIEELFDVCSTPNIIRVITESTGPN